MRVKDYNNLMKKLNGAKDITAYFDFFDSRNKKISENKLIFILPDGRCLFMPYSPNDDGERSGKYEHMVYLVKAFELILEEWGRDRDEYIQEKLNSNNLQELYYELAANILSLHVSFFYDLIKIDYEHNNERLSWFYKSPKLSEKQENTLREMKVALENENYGLGIQTLPSDSSINIKAQDIEMGIHGVRIKLEKEGQEDTTLNIRLKEILGKEGNPFKINDFYKIINVDLEQTR